MSADTYAHDVDVARHAKPAWTVLESVANIRFSHGAPMELQPKSRLKMLFTCYEIGLECYGLPRPAIAFCAPRGTACRALRIALLQLSCILPIACVEPCANPELASEGGVALGGTQDGPMLHAIANLEYRSFVSYGTRTV